MNRTERQKNSFRGSVAGPKATELALRDADMLKLRISGMQLHDIGAKYGLAKSTVHKAIAKRLQQAVSEPANELRAIEHHRLETLLAAVWPMALGGDLQSHEQARKVLADIRKLLGFEVHVKPDSVEEMPITELVSLLDMAGYKVTPKEPQDGTIETTGEDADDDHATEAEELEG